MVLDRALTEWHAGFRHRQPWFLFRFGSCEFHAGRVPYGSASTWDRTGASATAHLFSAAVGRENRTACSIREFVGFRRGNLQTAALPQAWEYREPQILFRLRFGMMRSKAKFQDQKLLTAESVNCKDQKLLTAESAENAEC